MFETVIVPLDGSSHAEFAIPYAVDEARRHGAKIVLVHIIPRPEPCTSTVRRSGPLPWQGEWPFEDLEPAKQEAHAYLQDVVTRFALDPGTTLCVAVGDPGVRVTTEAKRHPRPLVVMLTGDCSREAFPPLSLVASYLMIAGAIPVLGIRQPPSTTCQSTLDTAGAVDVQSRFSRPGPPMLPNPRPAVSPV